MRILIVDDDHEDSTLMRIALRRAIEQCEIITVGSQKEALSVFKPNSFDVAVIDVNLLCDSGYEVSRELRELDKKICIIVHTGDPFALDSERSFKFGATITLPKTIGFIDLIEYLKKDFYDDQKRKYQKQFSK